MHVKEDLHTGQMISFTDLGKANDHLLAFEQLITGGEEGSVLVLHDGFHGEGCIHKAEIPLHAAN